MIIGTKIKTKMSLRDCLYSALFTAIIGVLGFVYIPLPFSPVPITGQTLGVMLAGSILTTRQAAMSLTTFLLLGAVGAPVFAGGTGGLGIIGGPRGGYLIGFLVGAIIITRLKGSADNLLRLGAANIIGGVLVVYILGVLWRSFITQTSIYNIIAISTLPYIPGDILKACIATFVGFAVNKQVRRFISA